MLTALWTTLTPGVVVAAICAWLLWPAIQERRARRSVPISELRPGDTYRDHPDGPRLRVLRVGPVKSEPDMVTVQYEEHVTEWSTPAMLRMRLAGTVTITGTATVLDHDTSTRKAAA